MQLLQESSYGESVDYRWGSPHLTHRRLYDSLVEVLRDRLRELDRAGLPLTVLEIGAGHGGYTEPALAAGCSVTAVEMSRPSLQRLGHRYGTNPKLTTVFDADGTLSEVRGQYSLVLCVSVLHHVPDYLSFLRRATGRLVSGGSLLSLQDPLWYPTVSRPSRLLDRSGYCLWRLAQGNLRRGLGTLTRRVRGRYDESNPSDMVEYHVIRQGVDETAVQEQLGSSFETVSLLDYWSNQSSVCQRLGDRWALRNTFGVSATGYRGRPAGP